MPGMNGLEVASRLREAGSTAAVVFLTVHDDEDIMLAAKAAGAVGYVVKPRLCSARRLYTLTAPHDEASAAVGKPAERRKAAAAS